MGGYVSSEFIKTHTCAVKRLEPLLTAIKKKKIKNAHNNVIRAIVLATLTVHETW